MDLEPISDFSQRDWGFHTVRGGVDPTELDFLPRFVKVLDVWIDVWTGGGTISSPDGAGSIIYDPQPIRDRPVGGVGNPTLRGGISPGDIRVRSRFVGVVYVCMYYDTGMGPCRSRMTVILCTIPGQ